MRPLPTLSAALILAAVSFAADVPRPVPQMTFKFPGGSPLDLAAYRGKVVGLEFLFTTCPHCQKCSKVLQKMQDEYGPRGFQAVGVAINEMAGMLVPDFVKNFGIGFPVGWAPREQAQEFLQHPMMLALYVPQMVFIDRKGIIRAQYPGGDKFFEKEEENMKAQIESLLKDTGASKSGATGASGKKAATAPAAAKKPS